MARPAVSSPIAGCRQEPFIREGGGSRNGRNVHLLQWDVVRPAFESREILARYPERDGVTHPVVRKAVGRWVREAVVRWHRDHGSSSAMLIGEVPLIGNRLVELAQVHADDAEPLLAGPQTLFVTPVPSASVRAAIERARERTSANPVNPRESADAAINVLQELWRDTRMRAVERRSRAGDRQNRRSTRRLTPPSIATCCAVARRLRYAWTSSSGRTRRFTISR
jgi:hypothetical protein